MEEEVMVATVAHPVVVVSSVYYQFNFLKIMSIPQFIFLPRINRGAPDRSHGDGSFC